MKQVFMQKQLLQPATVKTEDVPAPRCHDTAVIIANRYSLISAGTESASVKRNVKDMVVKAATDPALRKSVVEMFAKDGLGRTLDRVHYETSKWTPLGYSGAGTALAVGSQVNGIRVGDLVAYGGEGHAEIIRAPKNLCVKVPEGVPAKAAAFVALGSIALQAVRRAEIQVGDVVVVVGMGLVGQLVAQILKTAGARVIAVDVQEGRLALARELGAELTLTASAAVPRHVVQATGGLGADRVMMCASTASNEVIEQAIEMARDRARIVMVGFVGMNVPQEKFYRKELELVVSRSYGPGRYDPVYEQHGVDYPAGYVRWTEQRNMEQFLRLVQAGAVNVERLVTHEFPLEQAEAAYKTLVDSPAGCLGILLRYDDTNPAPGESLVRVSAGRAEARRADRRPIGVAVVGCGGFARQFHLPNIKEHPDFTLRALVASSGQTAKEMGARYGALFCSTRFEDVLSDGDVEAVFVLTRDAAHASMTAKALRAGKHVFCEKPLALNRAECQLVADAARESGKLCMVGFNRRFAPLAVRAWQAVRRIPGPKSVIYRVNAGPLPQDNWVYDARYAAGRIVGEVCHFVDFVHWLLGGKLVAVASMGLGETTDISRLEDVGALLRFDDGSTATLVYTAVGTTDCAKERIEVYGGGTAIVLDDFRRLEMHGSIKSRETNRWGNKGHGEELAHFARAVRGLDAPLVTHVDGVWATLCCLAICQSVQHGGAPVAGGLVSVDELPATT